MRVRRGGGGGVRGEEGKRRGRRKVGYIRRGGSAGRGSIVHVSDDARSTRRRTRTCVQSLKFCHRHNGCINCNNSKLSFLFRSFHIYYVISRANVKVSTLCRASPVPCCSACISSVCHGQGISTDPDLVVDPCPHFTLSSSHNKHNTNTHS